MEYLIIKKCLLSPVFSGNFPTETFPRARHNLLPKAFGAGSNEALAEKKLKQYSAKNMPVGLVGYVPPWAIYRAPEGYFLRSHFPVFNAPTKNINIKIERLSPHNHCGLCIHSSAIKLCPLLEKYNETDMQCLIIRH
jgi:hypothetical protein